MLTAQERESQSCFELIKKKFAVTFQTPTTPVGAEFFLSCCAKCIEIIVSSDLVGLCEREKMYSSF